MRSAETEYQFDHFSATCRFDSPPRIENHSIHPEQVDGSEQCVAINPLHDLYGRILFHRGRFKRLGRYRRLKTTACLAEIKPDGTTSWFGQYLPARLVLGDPGAHDAAIHAIQACIPQSTILPTGINRVIFNQEKRAAIQLVRANEVLRVGETFTYDVELLSADGKVLEYWQGLRLQVVKGAAFHGPWPDSLLSNYIERRILELIPEAEFALTIERDGCVERCVRSERAVQRALGERLTVLRRSDGKPEAVDGRCVSASHAGELTLAVAARTPVSCDVEPVVERAASVWRDLLGQAYMGLAELISKECEEELDVAATRVWNAGECLKKVGLAAKAPLALTRSYSDGWLLFSSGEFTITSFVVPMLNPEEKLAMAVLVRSYDTSL
jgi:enediyne polyketide synthase